METSVDAVAKPKSVFKESVAKIVSDRSYESNIYYQRKKFKEAKLERERLQIELEKLKEVYRNQERLRQQSHRKKSRQNIINNKRNDLKPYRSSLECCWNQECRWGCGYVHLDRATSTMKSNCCMDGKLSPLQANPFYERYGLLQPLSPGMQDLMINNIEHMGPLSSTYSNVLSIAAIGIENGHKATGVKNTHVGGFELRGEGQPNCITMYGRSFHYMTQASDSLVKIDKVGSLSIWVFDFIVQEALSNHIEGINSKKRNVLYFVEVDIAIFIRDELLRVNPFCQNLNAIGNYIEALDDPEEVIYNQPNLIASLKSKVDYFDVANITVDRSNGQKILTIAMKGGQTGYVDINDERYESLSYPMFNQHGELGWGAKDSKIISPRRFYASRLLKPDLKSLDPNPITGGPDFLTAPHKTDFLEYGYVYRNNELYYENGQFERHMNINRFQLMARLMQVFAVDMVSRQEDRRIHYVVTRQPSILGGTGEQTMEHDDGSEHDSDSDDDEDDYDDDDINGINDLNDGCEKKPDKIFLPSSFHGSPRHRKKLALNALCIVTEMGKPTLFITGTVNVNWPEIQSRLLKGQTAFDRPDVVTQVFRCRLTKFIENLKAGKYFGGKKVDYIIYCIEYQWRGLPHFHLAVKMLDVDSDTEEQSVQFIDEYIKAEMPLRENFPNMSQGEFQSYANLVAKQMKHDCAVKVNGCKSKKEDFCRRGYDRTDTVAKSYIDVDGFVQYRRRNKEDFRVVPHNPETLLDWDGHLNVEFSSTVKQILYMFKYLYKGPKKQTFVIEEEKDDETMDNEISLYLKGRCLCSMDAFWRIFGFQTYPAPNPSVKSIKVKLPSQLKFLATELKKCDLLVYLSRPPALHHLKYTQFYNTYRVDNKLSMKYAKRPDLLNVEYFTVVIQSKLIYIFPRQRKDKITRMEMCYLRHGEIFYLRLILLKRPVLSFEDALTDQDGTKHKKFQLSAIAQGYVQNVEDCIAQFTEFATCSTGYQLRSYFALMVAHGFPMWPIWTNVEFKDKMMEGYPSKIENLLLIDLERLLEKEGTSLEKFGFPMPIDMESELEIAKVLYHPAKQQAILKQLESDYPRNAEQILVFDEIMNKINQFQFCSNREDFKNHEFYFLGALGGTGKTTVFKQLQAACRAKGIMIQCCASTTLAALLFEGATTAHSLFRYPVTEEVDKDPEYLSECKLDGSQRLDLLLATTVIFWDEFPSNDRELFEAAIRKLEQWTKKKYIFVCGGDFHQILPVVQGGSKNEIMKACIKSSPYWSQFHQLKLTENMRVNGLLKSLTSESTIHERKFVEEQRQYADFLVDLSQNRASKSLNVIHKNDEDSFKIGLPNMQYFTSDQPNDAVEWLYPNKKFDPTIALNSVILASTNDSVDKWNETIQNMNPNVGRTYEAKDSFDEVDDEANILKNILTDNVLNSYNKNGVPSHFVNFKVDDVCIVLRALPSLELATNTRVQVVELLQHSVKVKTLNEPKSRYICIPRITFQFRLQYGESYQLTRVQIPLRLAYAMTFNKSQSQTLDRVLIDCTGEPFAHGHAYVAFSRVRNCKNVRVYVNEDQLHESGNHPREMMPFITNIVYQEVIK